MSGAAGTDSVDSSSASDAPVDTGDDTDADDDVIESCAAPPIMSTRPIGIDSSIGSMRAVDLDGDPSTPAALVSMDGSRIETRAPYGDMELWASSLMPIDASQLAAFSLADDAFADLLAPTAAANYAYVLEGDGLGGFVLSHPALHVDGLMVHVVAAADFDGDGDDDVAGLMSDEDSQHSVVLALGDDAGQAPVLAGTIVQVEQSERFLVTHHAGDAAPDLVVGSSLRTQVVSLANTGDGTFVAAESVPSTYGPRALAPITWGSTNGVVAVSGGDDPPTLAIWHGDALEQLTEWELSVTDYDDNVAWMDQIDLFGAESGELVMRTTTFLYVVQGLDESPCVSTYSLAELGGIATVGLDVEATPGDELVIETSNEGGNALVILDFEPQ